MEENGGHRSRTVVGVQISGRAYTLFFQGMKERRRKGQTGFQEGCLFPSQEKLSTVKCNRKVKVVRSMLRVRQQVR